MMMIMKFRPYFNTFKICKRFSSDNSVNDGVWSKHFNYLWPITDFKKYSMTYNQFIESISSFHKALLADLDKDHTYVIIINDNDEIDLKDKKYIKWIFNYQDFTLDNFKHFIVRPFYDSGVSEEESDSVIFIRFWSGYVKKSNTWPSESVDLADKSQKGSFKRGVAKKEEYISRTTPSVKPSPLTSFGDVLNKLTKLSKAKKRKAFNRSVARGCSGKRRFTTSSINLSALDKKDPTDKINMSNTLDNYFKSTNYIVNNDI